MSEGAPMEAGAPAAVPGLPTSIPPSTTAAELPLSELIPEKHRAMREDGSLDTEATLRRVTKQAVSLEKHLGHGDIRPKDPSEYQLEVDDLPEDLRPFAEVLSETDVAAFKQEAHEWGLTPSQYQKVLAKYFQQLPTLANGLKQYDVQAATDELRQEWTSDVAFQQNIARADNAIRHYGGSDAESIFRDYGTDPRIARMMAKIGSEMGEGRAPSNALPNSGDTEDSLRSHPAMRDAKHPEHQRVSDQLSRLMQSKYGTERSF